MSERASQARQRRIGGSLRNREAISWGAGAERAADVRGPRENARRFRGVHVRGPGEEVVQ